MKNAICAFCLIPHLLLTASSLSQDLNSALSTGSVREVGPLAHYKPSKPLLDQGEDTLAVAKAIALQEAKSGSVWQPVEFREHAPETVNTLSAFRAAVSARVQSQWEVVKNESSCFKNVLGQATVEMLLDDDGQVISSKIEKSSLSPIQSEICLSIAAAAGPFPRLSRELQSILNKAPRRVTVQLVSADIPQQPRLVVVPKPERQSHEDFSRSIRDQLPHETDAGRFRRDKELCKRLSELGFKPCTVVSKSR